MLDMAVSLWNNVSQYQISPAQAISGNHPLKSVPFSGACRNGELPRFGFQSCKMTRLLSQRRGRGLGKWLTWRGLPPSQLFCSQNTVPSDLEFGSQSTG
jgi:hypothetical protein